MEASLTTAPVATLLSRAGLRVTAGRVAVLRLLAERSHLSAEQICQQLDSTEPKTSIQSIHNILSDLTEAALIHRIEPQGHPALYERRVGDNHHHVICRGCRSVTDIDCVVGYAPCLDPDSTQGYLIDTAEVTFWGYCPTCQTAAAATAPSHQPTDKEQHAR
jgi:Fur family ferric uptake transcriptional regulator